MKVIYHRKGGERQEWDYDPDDLTNREAQAMERVTGKSIDLLHEELKMGDSTARQAVLWHLLRGGNPNLKYTDVEFRNSEVRVEYNRAERAKTRADVAKATHLSELQKEAVIAHLDAEDAEEDAEQPGGGSPKAKQPAKPD